MMATVGCVDTDECKTSFDKCDTIGTSIGKHSCESKSSEQIHSEVPSEDNEDCLTRKAESGEVSAATSAAAVSDISISKESTSICARQNAICSDDDTIQREENPVNEELDESNPERLSKTQPILSPLRTRQGSQIFQKGSAPLIVLGSSPKSLSYSALKGTSLRINGLNNNKLSGSTLTPRLIIKGSTSSKPRHISNGIILNGSSLPHPTFRNHSIVNPPFVRRDSNNIRDPGGQGLKLAGSDKTNLPHKTHTMGVVCTEKSCVTNKSCSCGGVTANSPRPASTPACAEQCLTNGVDISEVNAEMNKNGLTSRDVVYDKEEISKMRFVDDDDNTVIDLTDIKTKSSVLNNVVIDLTEIDEKEEVNNKLAVLNNTVNKECDKKNVTMKSDVNSDSWKIGKNVFRVSEGKIDKNGLSLRKRSMSSIEDPLAVPLSKRRNTRCPSVSGSANNVEKSVRSFKDYVKDSVSGVKDSVSGVKDSVSCVKDSVSSVNEPISCVKDSISGVSGSASLVMSTEKLNQDIKTLADTNGLTRMDCDKQDHSDSVVNGINLPHSYSNGSRQHASGDFKLRCSKSVGLQLSNHNGCIHQTTTGLDLPTTTCLSLSTVSSVTSVIPSVTPVMSSVSCSSPSSSVSSPPSTPRSPTHTVLCKRNDVIGKLNVSPSFQVVMSCNNLPSPTSVLPNHSIKRRSQSFSSSKTLLTLSPSQGKSPSKTDHISNNKQTSPFLRESPSAGSRGLKKNCDDLSQHKPKLEPNCTTRQRSLSGNVISSKPTWKPSTLATTHHHSLSQSFNTATTSTSSSPLCTTLLSSTITTSSSSSVFSTIKFGPGPSRSNSASTTRSASMTPSSSSSHLAEPASAPPSPSGPPECKWKGCKASPLEANNLLDHLRLHAETHIKKKKYGCMWIGCKVYNKPSQSGSWLERHVVGHSGHRPFKCILGDCGQRFQSQASLERHVNSHFVAMAAKDAKTSRSKEEATSHRLALRRRRQLKRRSVQAVKKSDMFDESTMSAVRQELLSLTEAARVDLNTPTVNATFQGQIVGQRKLYSGSSTTESLVDFSPAHILSPQWLPQSEAVCLSDISVPLARLPTDSVTDLHRSLYRRHRFRKHRRK